MHSPPTRFSHRSAVAIAATAVLVWAVLPASVAAHPGLQERSQYQDSAGLAAAPSVAEPQEGVPRYFLRRDACGGDEPQNIRLSLTAGDPDGGDGCGFLAGWNALNEAFAALGDEEGLVVDYPAEDGLPFALDGTADITGTVTMQTFRGVEASPFGLGAGISQAHFTLTGQRTGVPGRELLGEATVEYLVTPDQQTYELDFQMPAPAEFDGDTLEFLNLRIRLDGPAVNHGFTALSGRSFVDLPGVAGEEGPSGPIELPTQRLSDVPCEDGRADVFACDGIDLLSFVPADQFDSVPGGISDLWGWTDPDNGDEYVLIGKTNGVGMFRVTDPTDPVYLGEIPNRAVLQRVWHDIKVFDDHAFIVSESEPHGMKVFDLTRLRDVTEPQEWDEDAFYRLHSAAHNIEVNVDTGFAYIVGGNAGLVAPDHCLSGLHIVDINTPTNPTFAGCYLEEGGPGTLFRTLGPAAEPFSPAAYVHDAQCVVYAGPDERYTGQEICFNSAERAVVIADVTDKLAPQTLGVVDYPMVGYTHQGWLTEDHEFLLVNDELDEVDFGIPTRTLVFDVRNLEDPTLHLEYFHDSRASTHNNYVHDGLAYHSNYAAGLWVTDTAAIGDPDGPGLEPVGFFDTHPAHSNPGFDGTWSNYPYFASGTIAVSGRAEGLFLLRLQDEITPPTEFTLTAEGRRVQGLHTVDLAWEGATSSEIDVLRDGGPVATVPNDGFHTDSTGNRGRATYTYQVCEAGTSTCSNEATVRFGGAPIR